MNPLGIPDDDFMALVEKRRTEHFFAAYRWPEMWQRRAFSHKRAADILYEACFKAWERDVARLQIEQATGARGSSYSSVLEGQEREDFEDQLMLGEYFILVGFGLECLLKGYLLAIIPDLVTEKRLDSLVAIHDISRLCHECGIEVTPDEDQLARLITRYIEWGKYTAPLRRKNISSWIAPEDQQELSLAVSNPYHNRRVQVLADAIFERACQRLESERIRQRSE